MGYGDIDRAEDAYMAADAAWQGVLDAEQAARNRLGLRGEDEAARLRESRARLVRFIRRQRPILRLAIDTAELGAGKHLDNMSRIAELEGEIARLRAERNDARRLARKFRRIAINLRGALREEQDARLRAALAAEGREGGAT